MKEQVVAVLFIPKSKSKANIEAQKLVANVSPRNTKPVDFAPSHS